MSRELTGIVSMRLLIVVLCLIFSTLTALAQGGATPRFEDYRVPVFKGRMAALKLNDTKARSFRTRLREGAKEGVNFAGHYTVVQWGCGAGCLQVAFIDAKTGAVFFPEELNGFGVWFWGEKDYDAVQFKPDSRLLVVSGFPASEGEGDEPKSGLYYYEWTGTRLRLVKLIEKKRETGR
jgi:hypothetical protein